MAKIPETCCAQTAVDFCDAIPLLFLHGAMHRPFYPPWDESPTADRYPTRIAQTLQGMSPNELQHFVATTTAHVLDRIPPEQFQEYMMEAMQGFGSPQRQMTTRRK